MPRRILPLVPDGLTVVGIEPATDPLIVRVVPRPGPTCCPTCRSSAGRKHGHCERTLADLPWQGRSVRLRLRLRRFRCANPACPRRTFSESVGDVAVAHARRSERLRVLQRHLGLALGGAPAAPPRRRCGASPFRSRVAWLLLSLPQKGSGGRHDTYGSALTAQPGESQRRPATNTSSQLILYIGLPASSCSRCLCPGWSHHTPGAASRPNRGTAIFIPVTNAIEALNATLRRAVRARGHFPTDEAALKLLYLVLNRSEKAWKMGPREWVMAKAQFAVIFGERFTRAMAA